MRLSYIILIIFVNFFIANITYASMPPREFCILNRPPYEGMAGYGYNALTNIDLLSNPREHNVSCSLLAGEPVLEIQTIAFTTPQKYPVKLVKDYRADSVVKVSKNQNFIDLSHNRGDTKLIIPSGETIYLLMYTGEGTYAAWYDNKIILWVEAINIKEFPMPNPAISPYIGIFMGNSPVKCEYWVKLEKSDGKSGWMVSDYKKLKIDWRRYKEIN